MLRDADICQMEYKTTYTTNICVSLCDMRTASLHNAETAVSGAKQSFRRMVWTVLAFCGIIAATAQEWNRHWIHHPRATKGEQVWFRRTLHIDEKPLTARITAACDGRMIVYVNGYNVSTDVFAPCGRWGTDTIQAVNYEVARFLRKGPNVVAVWAAPRSDSRKQLSLTLMTGNGECGPQVRNTDGNWLCRTNGCVTDADGNEIVDGSGYSDDWNKPYTDTMQWLTAEETTNCEPSVIVETPPIHYEARIVRISNGQPYNGDNSPTAFPNDRAAQKMTRITLRGMARGDTLSVSGLTYICSGQTDEQACRRFTTDTTDCVTISSNRDLTNENVTNIETLYIEPRLKKSWMY